MRPRDRLSRARKQDEGVVAIAEESGHPPLLGLDLAPGVPSIGIDGVGGVGAKVLREVAPLAPDLRCPLWLARRQGVEDGHPPMAEPPTAARKVDVHNNHFSCIARDRSTLSDNLLGRSSFLTPEPDSS
jgi:hypothetical protein